MVFQVLGVKTEKWEGKRVTPAPLFGDEILPFPIPDIYSFALATITSAGRSTRSFS